MLGIINPITRALTLFLVWTHGHHNIKEIIRLALRYYVKYQTIVKASKIIFVSTSIDFLSDCKSDKDVYHSVFARSDLHLVAEHIQEHIAHILCSYPQESVHENMGSVI